MPASTPLSMFVIPGKDQGPHARDKHQTRLKGRRVERASRLQRSISLLDPWSLPGMTARKVAVYESCRAFPAYDSHNISHACEYTIINVRHPWKDQGPYVRDKHQTRLKGRRVERASRLQCRISLLDPWSRPGMTVPKEPCMKVAGHFLRMIRISSAMQASTPLSMFVIPGKDQGTHASDKHQTLLKGQQAERASQLQRSISLLDPWSRPGMTVPKDRV